MANDGFGLLSGSLNGVLLSITAKVTFNRGGDKLETKLGGDRVHGPKRTPAAPNIKIEVSDMQGQDVIGLIIPGPNNTLQLSLYNGKEVSGTGMWLNDPPDTDVMEGSIPLNFEGYDNSVLVN